MPKKIDDIIVPGKPDRRSIRNIPLPEKRRSTDFTTKPPAKYSQTIESPLVQSVNVFKQNFGLTKNKDIKSQVEELSSGVESDYREPFMRKPAFFQRKETFVPPKESSSIEFTPKQGGGRSKKLFYGGVILGILILVFTVLSLFKSVLVTYTPKSSEISFNKDIYTAYRNSAEGKLGFSVIKLSEVKGTEVPVSGEEQVSSKASGKVIVYNNAGTASQKLIKNTRFQTPEGKVFRIQSDIVVPGKSGATPGSLEVTLYADQPGADYNIPLSDFTIPGLKGDPRFTTVYARSKTSMSGGFVGLSKKVSTDDLTKAKGVLEALLKDELLTQAKAQVPNDFILYPGLVQISYSDLPQSSPNDKTVTVNEHAEFYGVMFRKLDLGDFLYSKKVSATSTLGVTFPNLEVLDLSFATQNPIDLLKADSIGISVNGRATAVSFVFEDSLKSDLVGIQKSTLIDVLKKYPNIDTASATVRPFWASSFPNDASKIKIVKQNLK